MRFAWIVLLAACDGTVLTPDAGADAGVVLASPRGTSVEIEPRPDGRFDLRDDAGYLLLSGARAEALVGDVTHATSACNGVWASVEAPPRLAALGLDGVHRFECDDGTIQSVWYAGMRGDDAIVLALDLTNTSSAPITIVRASPLVVDGDGAAYLGARLARHRSLDGGADLVRDSEVHLRDLTDARPVSAFTRLMRGEIIANHSHLISDLDDGFLLALGFLETEHGFPLIGADARRSHSDPDPTTHRPGFALYADSQLLFDGKTLAPDETLAIEALFVSASVSPHRALEDLGDAIAAHQGIDLAHGNPTLWNSWSGGSGTGGLGQDIDETIIRENLAVAARDLAPFGFDTFPIDDGYQRADGDWEVDPAIWPSGMDGVLGDVAAAGLAPGVWAKLFVVEDTAPVAPDLLASPDDSRIDLLSPGGGRHALDLSNDDAIAWAAGEVARFRAEWGVRYFKLDFGYLAFPYGGGARPELTAVERYVRALRAVRAAAPDVHLIAIGLVGMSYGIADAVRTTYDNGPEWAEDDPFALIGQAGTFQGTIRTAARRWWLGGRVFMNHDDALHFRGAISDAEARALASFMALEGSTIDVGEDLRALGDADVETLRRVMPARADGIAARPIDLLVREYPEVYVRDEGDTTIVGLIHWGRNFDRSVEPALEIAEAPRSLGYDSTGRFFAYERWTHTFLGRVSDRLERTLMPRTAEVIALVPDDGLPHVLGGRHIVSDLGITTERTLTSFVVHVVIPAMPDGARPFTHVVDILVPDGWSLETPPAIGETSAPDPLVLRWTYEALPGVSSSVIDLDLGSP